MGFLKGVRDVKRMGDHHGGMPSIRGAFQDIGKLADDRGEAEVLKRGTPAKAVINGFPEPVPGDRFAMQIALTVHPAGGVPYGVTYVFPATRMKAPLSAGMEVPVKVLPDDPSRVAVQWDAQQGAIAAAGGDMAAVTRGMDNVYGSSADDAFRRAQAQQADPAKRLQKLQQLKDAGLIDDDEFAAKKSALLDEL